MADRPIIFTGESVRAILAGTKVQTRRLLNPQPTLSPRGFWTWGTYGWQGAAPLDWWKRDGKAKYTNGDRLWVREGWSPDRLDVYPCPRPVWYRADCGLTDRDIRDHDDCSPPLKCLRGGPTSECLQGLRWRSPMFMPRKYSRITLEVTAVRVERLHAISEEDAKAEGCERAPHFFAREVFANRWEAINGARAPWASDPWIWALSFRRVEVPRG